MIDALRDVVWSKSDGLCGICGEPVPRDRMHIDHIIPRVRGGRDTFDNMQASHPRCNMRKGAGEKPAPVPTPPLVVGARFLKVREVAAALETCNDTVRRWIHTGKLHAVFYGSDRAGWRIPESELERFLRDGPRT